MMLINIAAPTPKNAAAERDVPGMAGERSSEANDAGRTTSS
jgi:hypothetical protein